jgi:hypothetical protein
MTATIHSFLTTASMLLMGDPGRRRCRIVRAARGARASVAAADKF